MTSVNLGSVFGESKFGVALRHKAVEKCVLGPTPSDFLPGVSIGPGLRTLDP